MSDPGFVPPPYPYERLDALKRLADSLPGGIVDCSIGTPCDPVPEVASRAAARALDASMGYPASAGSAALRTAAAEWFGRRFDVAITTDQIGACVGTKEFVASLPHLLKLRSPARDTVLYPAVAYPTYEMGATLAGCRAVPVAVDTDWHLDLDSIAPADAERALVLWVNEPGNPTSSVADAARFAAIAEWARGHGVIVASDECYTEYAPEPATILRAGLTNVLAVHSLSKRSNLAGMRCGFYAGDPDLVTYLVETRKHAGLMVPTPVQAAATAALADDEHVAEQRHRYEERRKLVSDGLAAHGLVHDGGPCTFYLWLRAARGADDGWEIAARLAHAGTLVSPGDLYGAAGADHVRLALVQPAERLQLALDRLDVAARAAARLTKGRPVDDATLKQVTQLWEAGDGWRDLLAPAAAHDLVESVVGALDRGEIRVAEVVDGRVVVNEAAKHAILMWFRVNDMQPQEVGPFEYVDKLPLKHGYQSSGVRVVPGASARFGAFLAPGVVMMPSYVNIGARVDEGTMVDTWATVASSAQIGKRVHLSGGVGIGGVLEPPQAVPVVVEDDCFIGSRCMIVDGARVRQGAKLGAGVIITSSTPVIDAQTGEEVGRGDIPERAVVVQGIRNKEFPGGTFGLPCALILRYLAEGEVHDKLTLNAILREHGIVS